MSEQSSSAYRVLARKYRPDNLDGLIGQDALVKTLQNAITHGRLAHAFVLTGVRGVGKTSTARILARGLNCIGAEGTGGPTLNPCGQCEPCQAIAGSRHVDVLEMDAASNTGVDDVRDIIDGAAYKPVSARFKIYIIDEVHMLSKSAFNALLKTLEEPPEAVKFIFATTEIRKVPVTILSRCQRFDLRRVSVETLAAHLSSITASEAINAEAEALHMIARAAEGSVRDSLSLLDQAAAMNADEITASGVSDMLGHAGDQDIGLILQSCLSADVTGALAAFEKVDERGADAEKILSDLLDLTHYASLAAAGAPLADLPESTKTLTASLAELGIAKLGRAWQILLKGHGEVKSAPNARAAAQMILIRLAHSAPMPTPAEILRKLPDAPTANTSSAAKPGADTPATPTSSLASSPASSPSAATSQTAPDTATSASYDAPQSEVTSSDMAPPTAQMATTAMTANSGTDSALAGQTALAAPAEEPTPRPQITNLQEVVTLFEADGEFILASHIRNYVRVISLDEGHMEINLDEGAPDDLPSKMARHISASLGKAYLVSLGNAAGGLTLREAEEQAEQQAKDKAAETPLAAEILQLFNGAEVTSITSLSAIAEADAPSADEMDEPQNIDDEETSS